jgi:hypothetical protein
MLHHFFMATSTIACVVLAVAISKLASALSDLDEALRTIAVAIIQTFGMGRGGFGGCGDDSDSDTDDDSDQNDDDDDDDDDDDPRPHHSLDVVICGSLAWQPDVSHPCGFALKLCSVHRITWLAGPKCKVCCPCMVVACCCEGFRCPY